MAVLADLIKPAHLETSRVCFKKILVSTDFSPAADKALRAGIAMARLFGAELHIVNVVSPVVYPDRSNVMGPNILETEESAAWTAMLRIGDMPEVRKLSHREIVRSGAVVSTIEEIVDELGIDLVIVGSKGDQGLKKILLGSVAESLLRECSCPVLTVGPRAAPVTQDFNSILFPTALTTESLRANQYAVSLAEQSFATITFLHVLEGPAPANHAVAVEIRHRLKTQMIELLPEDARDWCRPKFKAQFGTTSINIIETAHEVKADLIVIGAHGSTTLADHAPWATVSKVIANAPCPVLTVRAHFESTR
jgi:nucleotide-binding universal stress UspA family protein